MRMREWLKDVCIRLYSNAVYCQACGHEIGGNHECAECVAVTNPPPEWSRRSNLVGEHRISSSYESPHNH
jgi:hypothetical protein